MDLVNTNVDRISGNSKHRCPARSDDVQDWADEEGAEYKEAVQNTVTRICHGRRARFPAASAKSLNTMRMISHGISWIVEGEIILTVIARYRPGPLKSSMLIQQFWMKGLPNVTL